MNEEPALATDHEGLILLDGTALPAVSATGPGPARRRAVRLPGRLSRVRRTPARPGPGGAYGDAASGRRPPRGAGRGPADADRTGAGEAHVRRRPGELSGGEPRRAALTRALLARPRVLVCDEITSGLDPVGRRALLDLPAARIRRRSGLCLVLITHDLSTAAPATRLAVMDGARRSNRGTGSRS
ncbi:ATP-binding cassette domain-containing protein [Streptomyces sp. SID3915]|uniref:ATP-binding cassette domain-containing protein n=1 Tax=Streptomyces sp. SID3915 TaxID=2690263 RepID=UPI0031FCD038